MNLAPIVVMDLILLVTTVLLAVADRLLVAYGQCKITVTQEDEKEEFHVEGGNYLLGYLAEHGINISSSCGGKATCGYCKVRVLSGGGAILPTEELFMTREEKLAGMRLACQVKVKNDLEVHIPDYLTVVRSIVNNRTYDPNLRWSFKIDSQSSTAPNGKKIALRLGDEEKMKLCAVIEEHKDSAGALVPVLQKINSLYNYLPAAALRLISENMNVPLSAVFRIATFYNAFSFKPRGRYTITICLGTACHVKGGANIAEALEKELGINIDETSDDAMFTLQAVRCIGCCGLAPVLKIGEDIHGLESVKKVSELIKSYQGA